MALEVKDGSGASRTKQTFVNSTEHADAVVIVKSDGTALAVATEAKQDAQIAAIGAPGDAAWTTGNGTIIALLKAIKGFLTGSIAVADGGGSLTVDGSVSISGTPAVTVSGVATDAKLDTQITALGAAGDAEATGNGSIIAILKRIRSLLGGTIAVSDGSGSLTVDGTVGVSGTVTTTDATVAATPAKYLSALSTNATSVKASAGTLFGLTVINTTATIYYLKLYNKASAPTVGTDIPVMTIPIPASTSGAGVSLWPSKGIAFSTGIAFALTAGIADNDTGNANVGVAINLAYV